MNYLVLILILFFISCSGIENKKFETEEYNYSVNIESDEELSERTRALSINYCASNFIDFPCIQDCYKIGSEFEMICEIYTTRESAIINCIRNSNNQFICECTGYLLNSSIDSRSNRCE